MTMQDLMLHGIGAEQTQGLAFLGNRLYQVQESRPCFFEEAWGSYYPKPEVNDLARLPETDLVGVAGSGYPYVHFYQLHPGGYHLQSTRPLPAVANPDFQGARFLDFSPDGEFVCVSHQSGGEWSSHDIFLLQGGNGFYKIADDFRMYMPGRVLNMGDYFLVGESESSTGDGLYIFSYQTGSLVEETMWAGNFVVPYQRFPAPHDDFFLGAVYGDDELVICRLTGATPTMIDQASGHGSMDERVGAAISPCGNYVVVGTLGTAPGGFYRVNWTDPDNPALEFIGTWQSNPASTEQQHNLEFHPYLPVVATPEYDGSLGLHAYTDTGMTLLQRVVVNGIPWACRWNQAGDLLFVGETPRFWGGGSYLRAFAFGPAYRDLANGAEYSFLLDVTG